MANNALPPVSSDMGRTFQPGPLLRHVDELEAKGVKCETILRLPRARVVFVNRAALQHDFPHLRDEALEAEHPELRALGGAAREQARREILSAWLSARCAFISRRQASQTLVNTHIETSDETITAYRPPRYGRALVLPLDGQEGGAGPGLIDVKGVGAAPKFEVGFKPHGSGLMKLGDAFREVIFQELVGLILKKAGMGCLPLPHYGVLDLGFDVVKKTGEGEPAGMLARRAHRRYEYSKGAKEPGSPLVSYELALEFLLRRHGITSVSPATTIELDMRDGATAIRYGYFDMQYEEANLQRLRAITGFDKGRMVIDGVNLQFTKEIETGMPYPQLLDFGGYGTRERFKNPVVSLVADRLMRLGEIIHTDDPRFTQPDERLWPPRVNGGNGRGRARQDSPEGSVRRMPDRAILSAQLAHDFRSGKVTGEGVRAVLDASLAAAGARW
ncbi:MAG: hypothetical protein QOJ70_3468 [Acidobacteriota bacterium]|jgi:hypothetical protein|nr:hypothetical protein [Acidobacteriota bacterium]